MIMKRRYFELAEQALEQWKNLDRDNLCSVDDFLMVFSEYDLAVLECILDKAIGREVILED